MADEFTGGCLCGAVRYPGGCLCGAVRYQGKGYRVIAGHCHCVDCRKASGTGHGSDMGMMADAISVTGDVKFFNSPADSGNEVSSGFCPNCGSTVYSKNSGMPGMVFLRASSLDDPEVFQPMFAVYASRAASWDKPAADLPAFDEMPPPEAMANMQK